MNWQEFDHPTGIQLASGIIIAVGLFTAVMLLIVIVYALLALSKMAGEEEAKRTGAPEINPLVKIWSKWYNGLTDVVPVEMQHNLVMSHDYDGIHELDNHLPPWWKGLFYASVVFAGVYLYMYHFSDAAPLQLAEYTAENKVAAREIAAYNARTANSVDENNVKMPTKPAELAAGKSVYTANCRACHGAAGEGGVGPNLTDGFWLHGNTVKDVFKTVKYGVTGKGMVSWQGKLKPLEIQQVAGYVLSLQGSNPPNGKAPQGKDYSAAKPQSAAM
ncbi:MAG: cbb3-type cytochrome c oxidase N-terminal domain-containing protein [Bacteroidota bacterium]